MKEKLLALLIAKFAGVRKDGLTQLARALSLQAANDEEAEALIGKLTKEQVDTYIKEFRADVDKEVTEGNKTFETNLKKKFDLVEKKNEPDPTDPAPAETDKNDVQAVIKAAILEAVKPLQDKLAGLEQGNLAKSRLQQLNEKISDCKDEVFKTKVLKDFSRMKFDTEEEFNEYLTETETDVTTVNQNLSDLGLGAQGRPIIPTNPKTGKEASEAELNAVMEKLPI